MPRWMPSIGPGVRDRPTPDVSHHIDLPRRKAPVSVRPRRAARISRGLCGRHSQVSVSSTSMILRPSPAFSIAARALSTSGSSGTGISLARHSRHLMLGTVIDDVELKIRFPIDDQVLSDLHGRAFGNRNSGPQPWAQRLEHHSLTWIGAFRNDTLIGFVHACWDGGSHAFLLDTIVDTTHRRHGVGQ